MENSPFPTPFYLLLQSVLKAINICCILMGEPASRCAPGHLFPALHPRTSCWQLVRIYTMERSLEGSGSLGRGVQSGGASWRS